MSINCQENSHIKLKITDLKDMLTKTNKLYGNNVAYKIKNKNGKYKLIKHNEVRSMVNALRNCANKYGIKK